jgi:hypothetical protein
MKILSLLLSLIVVPLCFIACTKDPAEFIENKPPIVLAGRDTTIDLSRVVSDSIQLIGSATDEDGTVIGYLWSQSEGPSQANIKTPGSSATYVNGLVSGKYVFKLMATDNKGAIGTKAVNVTIIQPNNTPPVVNAGNDVTIDLSNSASDSISLNGTAIDSDGTITSYQWIQVSGPTMAHFVNATNLSTVVKGISGGKYVFQLKATDNKGAVGTKNVTVIVIKNAPLNLVPVVNLGADTSIILSSITADSVRLSGSAIDIDGVIIGYLWSQVSGPKNAVIQTPGSASTSIAGLSAGSYIFQLMAIDDKGATGIKTKRVSITIATQTVTTIANLQPSNNPNEVHIWGNATDREGSFNGFSELGATTWTHGGIVVGQRGVFKFDLASVPVSATIISAKLSLYSNPTPLNGNLIEPNAGSNNAMLIQRVTSTWTASTVKWNNQPSTTTTNQILIPHTNQAMLDLIDVDVKDLVQAMVSGNANHGFLIKLQNETIYNSRIFCSSFHSNSNKHPKLIIQYSN